jgi:ribonuclease HII
MRAAACTMRKANSPTLKYEKDLWRNGLIHIAGFDEAGRGALAGPVAVAAVILPPNPRLTWTLAGVRDSKQMTSLQRETWAARIKSVALAWRVDFASVEEIDQLGIARGTRLAAARVLENLVLAPEYLLLDFRISLPESPLSQTALVRGDQISLSIASASVLAKTARDALMCELDAQHPGYGWRRNKGYGTQAHRSALMRLGYSTLHRKSFVIKELRST